MPSPPDSSVLDRKRRDVLILALVVILGLICAWFAFHYVDQPVCDMEKQWIEAPLCSVMLVIATYVGDWQLGPLLIALLLIAARKHWRRLLKTIFAAYILRTAVVEWLKLMTGRPRPRQIADAAVFEGFAGGSSFPSGHASFSFMMAAIISAWFPRWRWPAWIGAILISLSRVAVHAHFLSDVVVGAVIGTLAATLVLWAWPAVTEETRDAIEEQERLKKQRREEWLRSPEGRSAVARSRRLALRTLTVVLFIAGTLLAYWFVDPIEGFFDNVIFQHPVAQDLAQIGRHLGTWDLAPMLVAIALIIGRNFWKRLLGTILAGFVVQTALTEGLKWVIGRPRPSQIPDPDLFFGPGTEYHSLPSGHASFIFVFATICAHYFPRARKPVFALAAFVAASRVVVGSHYVSDIAFGALIGILSGWVVLAIWPVRTGKDGRQKPSRRKRRAEPATAPARREPGASPDEEQSGWRSLRMRPVDGDR